MESLLEKLTDWLKDMLVGGIMDNLTSTFSTLNQKIGEVTAQVAQTPDQFQPTVYNLIRNLSENVILPIAGIILTFIACYELIQLVIAHNNLANFETWIFFKWVFKTFVAVTLITNTFNITMAVFDVAQHVVNQSGSLIAGSTAVDGSTLATMQTTLEAMDVGPLFGIFLQSFAVKFLFEILSILIWAIVYGRMIEIYLTISLAPIPFATFGNREQSMIGQNYLRSLFALGFQGFLIMVCVAIYAALVQTVSFNFQQEQGLMSSLPLAYNEIEIQRGMTTSSTAIFVPFTTQELFQAGDEALYYGLNALSNNLIMVDRKKLKNPNGLILGTPGAGKSFSAKREIANAFLVTDDDVIISDPESEYSALVKRFGGQVIKISPTSSQYINPMDINMNYSDDDNPIALKADFILSLCELIVGGKEGLKPVEKTVIDRCIHQIYQQYFLNPIPENMPLLEDLYNALLKQDEPEAKNVATALEIYVTGSLNVFNHRTNVDITNRLVCYDIKDLGKQLKKIGMLVVQDQVWGRVTENRSQGKSTRYYMDEMHLLLREEQTAAYTVEIWKRFRKWGGIPTGITQNVKDLLASKEVENIFENSDFIYMLNQAVGDRAILAKQLNISPHQLSYVTHSGEGEGLLFYGNVILPFVDRFPKDLELYRIMTTKLDEVAQTQEEM